jgi:hypothetical protein
VGWIKISFFICLMLLIAVMLGGSAAGSAGQDARGITEFSPYRWHTFYGSANYDGSYGIASAVDGSIYLTGNSRANWLGDNGEEPLHSFTGTGFDDLVVMKLDSAGTYQWHTFYGSSDQDGGVKIALDDNGGIYIYGFSYVSWLDDGEEASSFTAGGSSIFVLKLDSNGLTMAPFYGPF